MFWAACLRRQKSRSRRQVGEGVRGAAQNHQERLYVEAPKLAVEDLPAERPTFGRFFAIGEGGSCVSADRSRL
jgi:hypothetical protein